MRTDENFKIVDILGKSEKEAREKAHEAGYTTRIVSENGKFFPVTRDYRTDRINLYIQSGMVYQADVG